jgi:hypothetical protein
MTPRKLNRSERRTEHPATALWMAVALLRLCLRPGPRQLKLVKEK